LNRIERKVENVKQKKTHSRWKMATKSKNRRAKKTQNQDAEGKVIEKIAPFKEFGR